jgi:hypothetical protein
MAISADQARNNVQRVQKRIDDNVVTNILPRFLESANSSIERASKKGLSCCTLSCQDAELADLNLDKQLSTHEDDTHEDYSVELNAMIREIMVERGYKYPSFYEQTCTDWHFTVSW